MDELVKCVLDTIIYYDVMDYPMTTFEIWKYLICQDGNCENKYSLEEVDEIMHEGCLVSKIESSHGFYFLRGREKLVEQRLRYNKLANQKFKIVQRAVEILRFVPFVRMIGVTGSMAMKNTDASSDLDLLIVLKHGRIFTGRLLVTLITHFMGRRRYRDKIKNRICLNYFITDKSLEIMLKDIFSASEYFFIMPVFGSRFFRKFQEENQWIKKYKPNFYSTASMNLYATKDSLASYKIRSLGEKIFAFDWLENYLKKWQQKRIELDPRTHQEGSMIVADDEMLIFLPDPQGPKVFEKFKTLSEKLSQRN